MGVDVGDAATEDDNKGDFKLIYMQRDFHYSLEAIQG